MKALVARGYETEGVADGRLFLVEFKNYLLSMS